MKRKILIIILPAYFLCGCVQKESAPTIVKSDDSKAVLLTQQLKSVFNCSFNSNYNNGRKINIQTVLDQKGINTPLSKLIKPQRNLLVLVVSDSYCLDCTHECMKMIDTIKKVYKKIDCIVVGAFSSPSAKNFLAKDLKINLYEGVFNLPANKAYQPYFFVLKSDMTIHDSFFPIASLKAYNHTYISSLIKYSE